ncbi:MAG: pitrilysin family protein [Candidatus Omnitrophota bacterium]|nr:pitrilysin family protein [Candidatus Omnitrophota bacterium]
MLAKSPDPIPEGFSFVQEVGGIREYRIDSNGLRILLFENDTAPVVTFMVTYLVGARHEIPGHTGKAHFLEHMMFKGTERYHKKRGTAIPSVLERTGAVLNASTWPDWTHYYEMLPSNYLELALDIESDRMRGALINEDEFEQEKRVVQNEMERFLDSSLMKLSVGVWKEAFRSHPYGNPVIGLRDDVQKMTRAQLKDFYDTYYWPNNAVVSVVGDFSIPDVLRKLKDKFGSIPRSEKDIVPTTAVEPPQEDIRRVEVIIKDGAEAVTIAHKIPPSRLPDEVALDALGFLLAQGRTSRLHRSLVESGLAVQVSSHTAGVYDPGIFTTQAILGPAVKHEAVEKAILEAYEEIREGEISDYEFVKVKHQLRAEMAYARDGSYAIASALGNSIGVGDWTLYAQYAKRVDALKVEDVQRVARQYLVPSAMTVGNLIESDDPQEKTDEETGARPVLLPEREDLPRPTETQLPAGSAKVGPPILKTNFSQRARVQQIGPVKVITLKTGIRDVVTLTGSFEGAVEPFTKSPVKVRILANLLQKQTQGREKLEIDRLLENRGARISIGSDNLYIRFDGRMLTKDVSDVLPLLAEKMRAPLLAEEDFENVKRQAIVSLHHEKTSTSQRARRGIARRVYAQGHPSYPLSHEEEMKRTEDVTLDDISIYYRDLFKPKNMVIVAVGDIDHDTFTGAVERAFKDWGIVQSTPGETEMTLALLERESSREVIRIDQKKNIDVYFGRPVPLTRSSEDYNAAFLVNQVLGGAFSARLSRSVRDTYGLTYSIRSGLTGMDAARPGAWLLHLIVNVPLLEKALAKTREELEAFAKDGISEQELAREKMATIGRYQVELATTSGLAKELLHAEELGLGLEYLDAFPGQIADVKLDQVRAAIRRYYVTDEFHLVIAGDPEEKVTA